MKSEADVCTIISHSLDDSIKIPDPSSAYRMASIRPFDGIATKTEDGIKHFVCWEAKFLKTLSAFSFTKIEPHQNHYLVTYSHCLGNISYVMLGIDVSRNDKRMYVFRWDDDMGRLYENKFSIHKAELDVLPYNEISKEKFTLEKIITYSDLNALYGEKLNGNSKL